jgi:hypothetical protein
MNPNPEGASPDERQDTESHFTRRDFAAMSGMAALGALLPMAPDLGKILYRFTPGVAANLVSEHNETLHGGGTKKTLVFEFNNLPPTGARSLQTTVFTRRPTSQGDVIEYDISFTPAVATGDGRFQLGNLHGRYEFVHGPVRGDVREDTVTISGVIGGLRYGPVTKKALRPLKSGGEFANMTSEQQLARALDLARQNGGMLPQGLPGMIRFLPSTGR